VSGLACTQTSGFGRYWCACSTRGLGVSCGHPRGGGQPNDRWLSEDEKKRLATVVDNQFRAGVLPPNDALKAKLELDVLEVASRTANASERNVKYMLWATVAAAVSAVANLLAVFVPLFIKH
jgi:hypothetical protein